MNNEYTDILHFKANTVFGIYINIFYFHTKSE